MRRRPIMRRTSATIGETRAAIEIRATIGGNVVTEISAATGINVVIEIVRALCSTRFSAAWTSVRMES